jgi:hypothetical protein
MVESNVELLGVKGTTFVVVRDLWAVRGVGALIYEVFGVSVSCLALLVRLEDDISVFAGEGLMTLARRLPVTKGCLMAT